MSRTRRPIVEPGGVLLVGLGLSDEALEAAMAALYPQSAALTVLVSTAQQELAQAADEVWVYGPLGLRGALALIRRISWHHFDAVHQPIPVALPYLRWFVWPRPDWHFGEVGG